MPVAAIAGGLNKFQKELIGTWTNMALPNTRTKEGSNTNPLSYNVMPLPQAPSYILKNFTLYEIVKFDGMTDVALPATAPNRAPAMLQAPTALFYQQQVFFAEGPGKDKIVHVENGAWLNMRSGKKLVGPYDGIELDKKNRQPPNITIAKQMSVPHGNSILALGSFSGPTAGAPVIPNSASVLPVGAVGAPPLDTTPYKTLLNKSSNYQNPQPRLTKNPNAPLKRAITLIRPNSYMFWAVSTANSGSTLNIPFEQKAANVDKYSAAYWLLSTDKGKTYKYLAYTQNISMQLHIGGHLYEFPHVTSNVVTKCPPSPKPRTRTRKRAARRA